MTFFECFTIDLRSPESRRYTVTEIAGKLIFKIGYRAVVYYRIAMYCKRELYPQWLARLISALLLVRIARVPGVEIRTVHEIGPGFVTFHPHDIVIGMGARIGKNVTIYNGVTLGARTLEELEDSPEALDRYPIIEEDVTIFTGAKLIGAITIGRNSIVGANAVVLESFPPDSIIVGIPAKLIGKRE